MKSTQSEACRHVDRELDFSDIIAIETDLSNRNDDDVDHVVAESRGYWLLAFFQITMHFLSNIFMIIVVTSEWKTTKSKINLHAAATVFVVASHVIGNIFSLTYVYRKMDFAGRKAAELICILMHFSMLGPMWRGLRLALTKEHADILDLNCIRLITTHIGDIPFVILQIVILFADPQSGSALRLSSVVVPFISGCLAIAGYNIVIQKSEFRTGSSIVSAICIHILLLLSRCLALAGFLFAWGRWLTLLLLGHPVLTVAVMYVVNGLSREMQPLSWELVSRWIFLCFDWLQSDTRQTIWHSVAFYAVIGAENLTIALCLASLSRSDASFNTVLSAVIACCFAIGMLCNLVRYQLSRATESDNTDERQVSSSPTKRSPAGIRRRRENASGQTFGSRTLANPTDERGKRGRPAQIWQASSGLSAPDDSRQNDSGFLSGTTTTPTQTADRASTEHEHNYNNCGYGFMGVEFYGGLDRKEYPHLMISPRKQFACARTSDSDGIDDVVTYSVTGSLRQMFGQFSDSTSSLTSSSTPGDLCDNNSRLTSSSDFESAFGLPYTGNDLAMTWPTFRRSTTGSRPTLPNDTLSWKDHVLVWLDKSITNSSYEWP